MLFNSLIFGLFSLVFFTGWFWAKRKNNSRWIYLTISSFIFYGWWDWRFLFLIIFSGLVDYFAGFMMIKQPQNKKQYLILSLVMNIGSLSLFKYSKFFAETLDSLLYILGISFSFYEHIPEFALILPVGISFYTFQSMSYTIDIYKGQLKPTKNIFHFFAYLSMFPQLVAGPIIRARDLLHQLTEDRKVDSIMLWHGLKLIVIGLFQKTVLADNIGELVNLCFNNNLTDTSNAFHWWVATLGFAFQIFFDFSGYSLIARGLAKLMGYHFKMNFNHPYLSFSLKEFWTRWHISLSTWFRDYVYLPLGGNRKGKLYAHLFMWITMILSGLWHGAAFTFIIWGAIHALGLTLEREVFKKLKIPFLKFLITMLFVLVGWVFFRANSLKQAFQIVSTMFSFDGELCYHKPWGFSYYILGFAILNEYGIFLKRKYVSIKKWLKNDFYEVFQLVVMITAILFIRGKELDFIYFQF